MINENFIRNRLTELRIIKGVSEYKMSVDMGHSKSYIQSITSGRALPSLSEFLYMCEYLGVSPAEFFSGENKNPILVNQILDNLKNMKDNDLNAILGIVERMSSK